MEDKLYCNQLERKAQIANGFCATSTEQEGLYYAGSCPFSHTENDTNRIYSELPSDPDRLNEVMCGPYNRKGLLCGECIDGYGPAVFSPTRNVKTVQSFPQDLLLVCTCFLSSLPSHYCLYVW